jgi:hypothetical protein
MALKKKVFLIIGLFFFSGCYQSEFDIYKALQLSEKDRENAEYLSFLKDLKVRGISYEKDPLTPDLSDGKLFGDRNLSKVKITKYFVYTENRTFDHKSSIFVSLNPKMIIYVKGYFDEIARITQIKSYTPPKIALPPRRIVAKRSDFNSDDLLPKGLLPPRLPDLSIGVDSPNIPDL